MKSYLLLLSSLFLFIHSYSQKNTGVVRGIVKDKNTQEALIGASVVLENTSFGALTDGEGKFKIEQIPVGSYNVQVSILGYQATTKYNINVTSGNDQILSFELSEEQIELDEVVISTDRSKKASQTDLITPLSTQTLTTEEIRSNPGGNFDISRVVQSLPGVAGSVGGFRNDIIIRGGAPNENVFYLDGIEIPVINHFSTQGSAGGPQGMINVSFLEDVKLSSSAFNARFDNALASTFEFKQREGNPERLSGNIRLSGTEFATTLEGPLSKKTNFIASGRRSYLQYLFQAIDLPIRPNYWDFQYKVSHKIDSTTSIKLIGLGAIDDFRFTVPKNSTPDKEYALRSNPIINQWNYTVGAVVKKLLKNGFANVALSRNMFDNNLDRFEDNQNGVEEKRSLKIRSQEIENKFRLDVNTFAKEWKLSYGVVGQYVKFNNQVYNRIRKEITDGMGNVVQPGFAFNFNSHIDFFRYGGFAQASRFILNNNLGISLGIRTDMNSFTKSGNNPLETLSPRVSLSYQLSNQWKINGSWGSYYKIPIYTLLGYRNEQNELVNKNMKYINSIHYVTGVEFLPKQDLRFTLEGFYKDYNRYPVSVRDGISLANQGTEFGAIGNEAVNSTGNGQAYGFEFYMQQKLVKNFFAIFSYTYVRSLFSGTDGKLKRSSWDYTHLVSGIVGRKFKRGWEVGLKYRFSGGAPFTPFNLEASRINYATLGTGILDVSQLNTGTLRNFNQFDFRVDKKWNFNKWTLDVFVDIQNALLFKSPAYPQYSFKRTDDNSQFATNDGQPLQADGSNAIPIILKDEDATVLPTFGFIIEF